MHNRLYGELNLWIFNVFFFFATFAVAILDRISQQKRIPPQRARSLIAC